MNRCLNQPLLFFLTCLFAWSESSLLHSETTPSLLTYSKAHGISIRMPLPDIKRGSKNLLVLGKPPNKKIHTQFVTIPQLMKSLFKPRERFSLITKKEDRHAFLLVKEAKPAPMDALIALEDSLILHRQSDIFSSSVALTNYVLEAEFSFPYQLELLAEASSPEAAEENNYDTYADEQYINPNYVHVILEPVHRATLSAQVSSPVISITKKMGESFKAGEVLIKLDDTIYDANLKKAISLFKQAKLNDDMRMQLFEDDIGSLTELKESQAKLAIARADLAMARKQMEATLIVAPYAGRVADIRVHEYELAETNQPLIDIIGDNVLIGKMLLNASMISKIAIGDVIQIHFETPDITVPAKIVRIGAEIDPASSTFRVDAQIENDQLNLTAGLTGIAVIPDKTDSKKLGG